jgi:uracil-DNA glycosylase
MQASETIDRDLREWADRPQRWSRYLDESWAGHSPGTHGMQPRMRHMFDALGFDLRQIPASNVVFVRTTSEADLRAEATEFLNRCWQFHETVIRQLGVRILVCLGGTAGQWVCSKVGAHKLLDTYRESNKRGWTSKAHVSPEGLAVVTVTHPGRADWRNPNADPTSLVRSVVHRR